MSNIEHEHKPEHEVAEFTVTTDDGIPTIALGNGDFVVSSYKAIGPEKLRALSFTAYRHEMSVGSVVNQAEFTATIDAPLMMVTFGKRECLESTIMQLQILLDGWSEDHD